MHDLASHFERRTTTDVVFDELREEIVSLKLLPGSKLSEADIARRFGVSRQPVRDAFARLENLDLLLIRPQKATEVRKFLMNRIAHSRFVRMAVELEVIRQACAIWQDSHSILVDTNLDQQRKAVEAGDLERFHTLDYEFHKLICELTGLPMAFETIQECKQHVDRLCYLSFEKADEPADLVQDHQELARALKTGAVEDAVGVTRHHLGRLDTTIAGIYAAHPEYFE